MKIIAALKLLLNTQICIYFQANMIQKTEKIGIEIIFRSLKKKKKTPR